jgi:hypothetical protein
MTREARRSRRRWRRLRRDLPHVPAAPDATDEVAPDFILTRDGITAVEVGAPPAPPSA